MFDMTTNDTTPQYGRLGVDFQKCNDADNRICHHIDHVNQNQMLTWLQCRQNQTDNAVFMKQRVQHGFYDNNADIIKLETNRIINGEPITDYRQSTYAIEQLYNIFSETLDGYGLLSAIASDAYDYRMQHDITKPLLIMNNDNHNNSIAKLLSTAREAAHWFQTDIGEILEKIANGNFHQNNWDLTNQPKSFATLYADTDTHGIIKHIYITDNTLTTYAYDFTRPQYDTNACNEIIKLISGKPMIIKNEQYTLTALCLQVNGFLPKLKIGVIQPVSIRHFMPTISMHNKTIIPSTDMMIAMRLASLQEVA